MAKLYFYYSTMDAGKTTHLLQYNNNFAIKNIKTLLFTPIISNKNGLIISRLGIKKKAIKITKQFNIYKYMKKIHDTNHIFIDEAQFLTKKHIFELITIVDILKISVFAYGLRTDFKSQLFIGSKYLLAFADNLIEIKTLCKCGNKATMNARLLNGKKTLKGKQINTNKDIYTSTCRYHYYKYKIL